MTTKHTPGPWVVHNESGKLVIRAEKAGSVTRVFVADCGLDLLAQTNAALIAQAPELLTERDRLREVNAELLAALELIANQCGTFAVVMPALDYASIGNVARAALAKAKE